LRPFVFSTAVDVHRLAAKAAIALNQHRGTPARAELTFAESPPGPLPTTRTSVSARTGLNLAGSLISFMDLDLRRYATQHPGDSVY
jgi:hypothetical protein